MYVGINNVGGRMNAWLSPLLCLFIKGCRLDLERPRLFIDPLLLWLLSSPHGVSGWEYTFGIERCGSIKIVSAKSTLLRVLSSCLVTYTEHFCDQNARRCKRLLEGSLSIPEKENPERTSMVDYKQSRIETSENWSRGKCCRRRLGRHLPMSFLEAVTRSVLELKGGVAAT